VLLQYIKITVSLRTSYALVSSRSMHHVCTQSRIEA